MYFSNVSAPYSSTVSCRCIKIHEKYPYTYANIFVFYILFSRICIMYFKIRFLEHSCIFRVCLTRTVQLCRADAYKYMRSTNMHTQIYLYSLFSSHVFVSYMLRVKYREHSCILRVCAPYSPTVSCRCIKIPEKSPNTQINMFIFWTMFLFILTMYFCSRFVEHSCIFKVSAPYSPTVSCRCNKIPEESPYTHANIFTFYILSICILIMYCCSRLLKHSCIFVSSPYNPTVSCTCIKIFQKYWKFTCMNSHTCKQNHTPASRMIT